DVIGHDDVGALVDFEVGVGNAAACELIELCENYLGVYDNAVADDAYCIFIENSRRDKMELIDLVADLDCMACVVAALGTDAHLSATRQDVYYLTLSLVAPLGADYYF